MKTLWRLTRRSFRGSISLRENVAKVFLRTLGFMYTIAGGLHCFAHVVSFLLKKYRRHWRVLRLVEEFIKRGRRPVRANIKCRIAVCGKFGGSMRTRKHVFGVGVMSLFKFKVRTDFTSAESFTK